MKTLYLTLTLLLVAAAGYAQTADEKPRQFPFIQYKPLNLQYIGKDSTSVLERIGYNGLNEISSQEPSVSAETEATHGFKYNMPIMRPDSSIDFQILAIQPDPSIHYHLLIKRPQ